MTDTLFGISAFRYHRTPPQVLGLLPPIPQFENDRRRQSLRDHMLIREIVAFPIHVLVSERTKRAGSKTLKYHLVSGELPFGSIWETEHEFSVASPLFTLYQLAATLSKTQLAMAMYEMCGTFTTFKPSPVIEDLLEAARAHGCLPTSNWRRVTDNSSRPSRHLRHSSPYCSQLLEKKAAKGSGALKTISRLA